MAATAINVLSLDPPASRNELVGYDTGLRQVWNAVQMVSRWGTAVLIQGETGTGKELVARAIHEESPRSNRPYVKVNCAALPAGLLESELFGHERGAFTGASNQTLGRFQIAHTGTLFLDEIGELPLELQPKLLRVLQEHEFERLGSHQTIRTDVRIVAATNQDLAQMVRERKFRADLYYRLNVFPIEIPPLRQRVADIPLLINHFINHAARRMNKEVGIVPDKMMAWLMRHDWPGNVRELQNVVERSVIMYSRDEWHFTLDKVNPAGADCGERLRATLAYVEREHILGAIRDCRGIVGGRNGAAVRLGLPRTTLLAKMKRIGINLADSQLQFEADSPNDPPVQYTFIPVSPKTSPLM
jgi:formate hydrogenlyase transcriptional activator